LYFFCDDFLCFFWVFLFLFHLVITCSFCTREGAGFGWVSALGFWPLGRHHPRPGKLGAQISQTPPTPLCEWQVPHYWNIVGERVRSGRNMRESTA
jgi:hypothetical protein